MSARLGWIEAGVRDNSRMSIASTSQPVVYDGAVTTEDVDRWESELEGLLARIRPLFYRTESQRHAEQYVRGLLSPLERKNGWTIAVSRSQRHCSAC